MFIISMVLTIIFSVFSTIVMSYISMATAIGPWIAPTIVLLGLILFRMLAIQSYEKPLGLITSASSLGGIIATGMGFSFPTLYFLSPTIFNTWMASPTYFCFIMSTLSLICGIFGVWMADVFEKTLLVDQQLKFPVGQMVYKMIAIQNSLRKAYELVAGFFGTVVFCFLQDGLGKFMGIIPKTVCFISKMTWRVICIPSIQFDMWPMLWAIGFLAGHLIALPLAVGAFSAILLIGPMHKLFFQSLSYVEFLLAFCSGMVIASAISGFWELPGMLYKTAKNFFAQSAQVVRWNNVEIIRRSKPVQFGVSLLLFVPFFVYFKFTLLQQVYLLSLTILCAYHMTAIAGKIGLALMGRYATFVMVPAMFIFNVDLIQLVFISVFVEVVGGVVTDILFSRKMAYMASIDVTLMRRYQYAGIIISSLSVGIVFWVLINHFGLGSPELFAYKAQARRLLIDAKQFNILAMFMGGVFGWLLKKIKVNPTLVFGGLLMPLNISLGLIFGGLLSHVVKQKEEWEPIWSGVFAANSIWMLLKSVW